MFPTVTCKPLPFSHILTGLYSSIRSSCSGVHLSSTGSRTSNGTPPVSYSTEKRPPPHHHHPHFQCEPHAGRPTRPPTKTWIYSQLMLFCSVRTHCWCKLIIDGRKMVLAPEYTCIFLLSRWPVKTADSSEASQKSDSFVTSGQK